MVPSFKPGDWGPGTMQSSRKYRVQDQMKAPQTLFCVSAWRGKEGREAIKSSGGRISFGTEVHPGKETEKARAVSAAVTYSTRKHNHNSNLEGPP